MKEPILVVRDDREYLCLPGEELQTDLGVLEVPEAVEPGVVLETHLGERFRTRQLRGPDLFHHLERSGAPMVPRDIGLLVGETGVHAGDRVLDVGTGTGVLAAYLGRLGATVVTYERDAAAAATAEENMAVAGVEHAVEVRTGDLQDDIGAVGTFDVFTLDTADAPALAERAGDVLVAGGALAAYSPFVEAARAVVGVLEAGPFDGVRCLETIQRHMDFDERGSRPSTGPVGHTGYLTVARRL